MDEIVKVLTIVGGIAILIGLASLFAGSSMSKLKKRIWKLIALVLLVLSVILFSAGAVIYLAVGLDNDTMMVLAGLSLTVFVAISCALAWETHQAIK